MSVSVVIPAFNVAAWIAATIDTVLAQSRPADEIVVIDDGSTDDTARVLERYGGALRVVRQPNRGLAEARNAGADAATGDRLFFLDGDDTLLPTCLERVGAAMDALPGVAVVVPNFYEVRADETHVHWPVHSGIRLLGREAATAQIRRNDLSSNAMHRREVFLRHRFRPMAWGNEDMDLWIRMLLAGEQVAMFGEPLVNYVIHREGSMSDDVAGMRGGRAALYRSLLERTDLTTREQWRAGMGYARTSAGRWLAERRGTPRHDARA